MKAAQDLDFDYAKLGYASGPCPHAGLFKVASASFAAGAVIYSEGSKFNGVYFVERGMAKTEMSHDGELRLANWGSRREGDR